MKSCDNPNNILQLLRDKFQSNTEMTTLFIVGSYTANDGKHADIDLLTLFKHGDIEIYAHDVGEILNSVLPRVTITRSDDSLICQTNSSLKLGVAIHDSDVIVRRIEHFAKGIMLDGQHKPWASGYWLPEALCADIVASQTLFDSTETGSYLRELVYPYPTELSRSICKLCIEEIQNKLSRLEYSTPADSNSIEMTLVTSDIVAALTRYAFASDRCYIRGFKRINQQKSQLSVHGQFLIKLAERLSMRLATYEDFQTIIKEMMNAVHERS